MELIRDLCSIEGRGPGTDAERRAAKLLADRLRGLGRKAELEPTFVHPQYALVFTLCTPRSPSPAASSRSRSRPSGSPWSSSPPPPPTWTSTPASICSARSSSAAPPRTSSRAGQKPEAPGRLILVAHYDAARTGYVFSRGSEPRQAPVRARPPRCSGPCGSSSGAASCPSSPSSAADGRGRRAVALACCRRSRRSS